jgi:hypothetical protein
MLDRRPAFVPMHPTLFDLFRHPISILAHLRHGWNGANNVTLVRRLKHSSVNVASAEDLAYSWMRHRQKRVFYHAVPVFPVTVVGALSTLRPAVDSFNSSTGCRLLTLL